MHSWGSGIGYSKTSNHIVGIFNYREFTNETFAKKRVRPCVEPCLDELSGGLVD